MFRTIRSTVLSLCLSSTFAASASAQEFAFTLGKATKHGSFSLTLGSGRRTQVKPFCEPSRVWVEGRYETRCERVWVPGCERQDWVPAQYEWRITSCGERYQVLVRPGYWRTVHQPGRYELREIKIWVPGYWRAHDRGHGGGRGY